MAKENGLVPDGLIGAKTKAMMNATSLQPLPRQLPLLLQLQITTSAPLLLKMEVKVTQSELQRFLNDKLNLGLVLDGRLGPKTIAVIKQWQTDNGLVADGLIGPATKAR